MNISKPIEWKDLEKGERTSILRDNFEKGTSAGVVAATLPDLNIFGATRNAIIGHVHRNMAGELLCMSNNRGGRPVKASPRPRVERRSPLQSLRPKFKPNALKSTTQKIEPPDPAKAKTILELGDKDCRFPLWAHNVPKADEDGLYCGGGLKPGSVYCAHHHSICNETVVMRKRGRVG